MTDKTLVVAHGSAPGDVRPAWRTRTGRAVSGVAIVLLVLVLAVDLLSEVVVVLGDGVLETSWTTFVLGPVAAVLGLVGWLLLRSRGRLGDRELGVVVAIVLGGALALAVPLFPGVLLVMFFLALPLVLVVGSWATVVPIGVVVAIAVVAARHLRPAHRALVRPVAVGRPRRAADAVGIAALTLSGVCALLGSAVLSTEDRVAVEHGPGGCAVVLHEDQVLFTGEVSVYRAPAGSPLAFAVESTVVKDTFPVREEKYALTFDGADTQLVLGERFRSGEGTRITIPGCR